MADEIIIPIRSDLDIIQARQQGRTIAAEVGFNGSDLTVIATAISELARNILKYASVGEIIICPIHQSSRQGIMVVAKDEGPGIVDISQALRDGYTTSQGLGLGLPGTRRLMDEFDIVSVVGKGTTVTVKKWLP
ncbi:MAG TPA: anti-sigma regulatory factor [Bacteroidota bacterium]|nr:anti-sigma regulatory factor [Bacteroidota bacterium]